MIKTPLNINMEEKKILSTHLPLHHPPFRYDPAYTASIQILP
jgi:hypothetical protein